MTQYVNVLTIDLTKSGHLRNLYVQDFYPKFKNMGEDVVNAVFVKMKRKLVTFKEAPRVMHQVSFR